MTGSTLSDEADPLYQPLGGLDPFAAAPVDAATWEDAVAHLRAIADGAPDWVDMVRRGAILAAAHQSGAIDSMHAANPDVAMALLRGEAALASVDEAERAHVRANDAALQLARTVGGVTEAAIGQVHAAACRAQPLHRVLVDDHEQDHVLAAGEYKHHPNHALTDTGEIRPTAPVAMVEPEMAQVVAVATGTDFAAVHPAAQAAWLHHALLHVQPFADGNGRVARALAGGVLLRAIDLPLMVFAGDPSYDPTATPEETVALVQRAVVDLVVRLTDADRHGPALDHWQERSAAADGMRARLGPALDDALDRHQRRTDRRADLKGATVDLGDAVTVRVPDAEVTEVLILDTHPLVDGPLSVTAREAGLRLVDGDPLGPWVDRVVNILALRVAVELEEPGQAPT